MLRSFNGIDLTSPGFGAFNFWPENPFLEATTKQLNGFKKQQTSPVLLTKSSFFWLVVSGKIKMFQTTTNQFLVDSITMFVASPWFIPKKNFGTSKVFLPCPIPQLHQCKCRQWQQQRPEPCESRHVTQVSRVDSGELR